MTAPTHGLTSLLLGLQQVAWDASAREMSAWEASLKQDQDQQQQPARRTGLWLEFGAYRGESTLKIANKTGRFTEGGRVFSFDSFQGLPSKWRTSAQGVTDAQRKAFDHKWLDAGAFDLRGKPPFEHPLIRWVVGWYNESLPPFLATHRGNVSFVHVDCDIYASASLVLQLLQPRLSPGAVIVFDELINYPEFRDHEFRALRELQSRTGRSVRVLGLEARRVLDGSPDDIRAYVLKNGEGCGRTHCQSAAVQLL